MTKWAVWPLAVMAAMLMQTMAATAVSAQDQDKRPSQPLLRARLAVWPLAVMAAMLMLAMAATAVSAQELDKRPSQPLLQDYYSGSIKVQGHWAPIGTALVACVESCETYQSQPVSVVLNGRFTGLVIAPTDRRMIGPRRHLPPHHQLRQHPGPTRPRSSTASTTSTSPP